MNKEILDFYKQTSLYTDLGFYKYFMKNQTNNINELCVLQRMQMIHPIAFSNSNILKTNDPFWGDIREIEKSRLKCEDELFPTAISMISELLRKDEKYHKQRKAKDKIHITCRGQAILLAAILKAKKIPARVRSGLALYIKYDGIYYDHWITEYYDKKRNRWVLVDADEHCPDHEMGFDLNDVPRDKFIFGAEAYLGIRNKKYKEKEFYHASNPPELGLKAAIRALFYDFYCLMNNEVLYWYIPKYLIEKDFDLNEQEYKELDSLATLLLNPDENFDKLLKIWNNKLKFRMLKNSFSN